MHIVYNLETIISIHSIHVALNKKQRHKHTQTILYECEIRIWVLVHFDFEIDAKLVYGLLFAR